MSPCERITALVSENALQNRRGRPKAFSDADLVRTRAVMDIPLIACRRTQIDHMYALTAYQRLPFQRSAHKFQWLTEETWDGRYKRMHLLVAIGRIKNRPAARTFARELCNRKPSVRVGKKLIHTWWNRVETRFAFHIVSGQSMSVREQFRLSRQVVATN